MIDDWENEGGFVPAARSSVRCDGCASPWKYDTASGRWCSDCYVPILQKRLEDAIELHKALQDALVKAVDWLDIETPEVVLEKIAKAQNFGEGER